MGIYGHIFTALQITEKIPFNIQFNDSVQLRNYYGHHYFEGYKRRGDMRFKKELPNYNGKENEILLWGVFLL